VITLEVIEHYCSTDKERVARAILTAQDYYEKSWDIGLNDYRATVEESVIYAVQKCNLARFWVRIITKLCDTRQYNDLIRSWAKMQVKNSSYSSPILDLLKIGIKDSDEEVRKAVIESPMVTPEILEIGIKDRSWRVRLAVIHSPLVTPEILEIGIKDSDEEVRKAVIQNSKVTLKVLEIGIHDKMRNIKYAVIQSPLITPKLLEIGIKDKDILIRKAVIQSPMVTLEILEIGIKDESEEVREAVIKRVSRHLRLIK